MGQRLKYTKHGKEIVKFPFIPKNIKGLKYNGPLILLVNTFKHLISRYQFLPYHDKRASLGTMVRLLHCDFDVTGLKHEKLLSVHGQTAYI